MPSALLPVFPQHFHRPAALLHLRCHCLLLLQATCLQTMYDYLLKASQYVQEMKAAFGGVKEEHE